MARTRDLVISTQSRVRISISASITDAIEWNVKIKILVGSCFNIAANHSIWNNLRGRFACPPTSSGPMDPEQSILSNSDTRCQKSRDSSFHRSNEWINSDKFGSQSNCRFNKGVIFWLTNIEQKFLSRQNVIWNVNNGENGLSWWNWKCLLLYSIYRVGCGADISCEVSSINNYRPSVWYSVENSLYALNCGNDRCILKVTNIVSTLCFLRSF